MSQEYLNSELDYVSCFWRRASLEYYFSFLSRESATKFYEQRPHVVVFFLRLFFVCFEFVHTHTHTQRLERPSEYI